VGNAEVVAVDGHQSSKWVSGPSRRNCAEKSEDRRTNWLTSRDEIPLTEFSTAAAKNQLQIHHTEFRSHNGEDSEENLITLCATSFVHGSHSLATSAASYCEWIADSVVQRFGKLASVHFAGGDGIAPPSFGLKWKRL
jgi:hypothetical protein